MKIHLRGYLTIKDLVGDRQVELSDESSVRSLLIYLCEEIGDDFESLIQFDQDGDLVETMVVLVNGRAANHLPDGLDTSLESGDEVAMFPPIAGGSREGGIRDTFFSMETTADLINLSTIREFIQFAARMYGADRSAVADIVLAVDETASNIMLHGYSQAPGIIKVIIECQEGVMKVSIRDQAPPFDPTSAAPPDLDLPLDRRPLGGLGIHLIRELTDRVEYTRTPDGTNLLTLYKRACKN
jgi:serine/threonine-protein kinase RsbW